MSAEPLELTAIAAIVARDEALGPNVTPDWPMVCAYDRRALLAEVKRLREQEQRIRALHRSLMTPDRYIVDNTGVAALLLTALDGGAS